MNELIEIGKTWFFTLGKKYSVNPIVFVSIYVGTIPLFTASLAWLIRNYRKKRPVLLPSLCAAFFFVSAYLYLMVEGDNVPWWMYSLIVVMAGCGLWSAYRKIRCKVANTN